MGHDIFLYRLEDDPTRKEKAYLRRSAFNPARHDIYKIMGFDNDADCSGDGSYQILKKEDDGEEVNEWLTEAKKLKQSDLLKFFKKMKKEIEEYGQVLIHFA